MHQTPSRLLRSRGSWASRLAAILALCCAPQQPPQSATAPAAPRAPAPAAGDDSGAGARGEEGTAQALMPAGPPAAEARTTSVIQQRVQQHRRGFRDCYEDFLIGHPAIAADMTLHFVIGPDGKVKSAEVDDARSTNADPEFSACLIERVRELTFPPSSQGFESKVNYPFNFNP